MAVVTEMQNAECFTGEGRDSWVGFEEPRVHENLEESSYAEVDYYMNKKVD